MKNIEVAIAVIENEKGQLLFQYRKKQPYQGYLGLVGGKVEESETREHALFREVEEETGIVSHQAQFFGEVIESLITDTEITAAVLYIYGIKAGGELRASESEGDVFWVDKASFFSEREKYIPTDWLIVESVIHHNNIVNKIVIKIQEKHMKSNQSNSFSHRSLIIGSFRKHYQDMTNVIRLFHENGIEVLSPKEAEILNPDDEFVVFDYDPKHLSEKELEDLVLKKMHKCHFVYLVNPGGYVGLSASFEVGYCAAHGIDVYAMEPSTELCAKYIKDFLKPTEMASVALKRYESNRN